VTVTLLVPDISWPAIEERFAALHSQLLLQRSLGGPAVVRRYDPSRPAREIVAGLTSETVVVITDPLIAVPPGLGARLLDELDRSGADAAIPTANDSPAESQRVQPPSLYLTLRQLERTAESLAHDAAAQIVQWDGADPALFAARTAILQQSERPMREALAEKSVAVVHATYLHKFASQRGQLRLDLLERIPADTSSILEFGCGEAALGEALKQRQPCRVVGIELDEAAAAIARSRIDEVYGGDVRQVIATLDERFDLIIGGDIVEHLDDPWSFLSDLRRLAAPGGRLLLSLPNISNWAIVSDLLLGRFDYVYLGILCAGHLRFFTRSSIRDLLAMSGWEEVSVEPQGELVTEEFHQLITKLDASGIEYDKDELVPLGWYVTAKA
jgi:2-polyprenyl-3-methyl-5-hydroxy-6-metoxy-1,4-benzoquinol methylase